MDTTQPSPASIPGRPVARDVGDRLQALILDMAEDMLRGGYDTDDVQALASLISASAEHSQAGLAVRSFMTAQREETARA